VDTWGRVGNRRLRFSLCITLNAVVTVILSSNAKPIGECVIARFIIPVSIVQLCHSRTVVVVDEIGTMSIRYYDL